MSEDYTRTPTAIRVFFEDTGWSIDATDDTGNYTEAIWDHYDGERMTREQAIAHAPEFAASFGWSDLPIIIREEETP